MTDFPQAPLVQPEGVDSGSAAALDEDETPPPADAAVGGGDPDHDDPDAVPRDRDLLGAVETLEAVEALEEPGAEAAASSDEKAP